VVDVLRRVNADLARTPGGLPSLRQKLLRMDTTGSGSVHADEVRLAFNYVHLPLSLGDIDVLLKHFCTSQLKMVDVRNMLSQLEMLSSAAAR
jgi:hypothetical protein